MGVHDSVSVAITALQEAATRLRDEVAASGADLTSCSTQIASQHSGWGPAAEAASTALQQAWDRADSALLGSLSTIAKGLDTAARAYAAMDAESAGLISRLQS
ncbi:WXG100 family type VII secretion target [Nocardia sp. NPDC058666]|uniref:WXG100 family type VII secretion target n=1 Tax=Nocardia sp. NPDC058666 TaxID=3346587 RepID=UPI00365BC403